MVVTEMPKALFKKPKVNDYSSNRNAAVELMKPQFPNRRSNAKNIHSQGKLGKKSDAYIVIHYQLV